MKRWISLVAPVVFGLGLPTVAVAQAKIDDCEKIQAADAYNQCLAKFGPPAKIGNLEPERPGDIKSSGAEAAASGGNPSIKGRVVRGRHGRRVGVVAHRGGRGHVARAARGGRKRMTISVHR